MMLHCYLYMTINFNICFLYYTTHNSQWSGTNNTEQVLCIQITQHRVSTSMTKGHISCSGTDGPHPADPIFYIYPEKSHNTAPESKNSDAAFAFSIRCDSINGARSWARLLDYFTQILHQLSEPWTQSRGKILSFITGYKSKTYHVDVTEMSPASKTGFLLETSAQTLSLDVKRLQLNCNKTTFIDVFLLIFKQWFAIRPKKRLVFFKLRNLLLFIHLELLL